MSSEEDCERALELHADRMFDLANVVGVGVVQPDDAEEGELSVAVYVEKKAPLDELAEEDHIPPTLEVPDGEAVTEVSVRVIEQGPVSLE